MIGGRRAAFVALLATLLAACAVVTFAGPAERAQAAREPASTPSQGTAPVPPRQPELAPELRAAWMAFKAGDYERAMLGYEHIAGNAGDPRMQIRALISLAMIRLLPSSKMHDADAARVVLDELDKRIGQSALRYEFFGELELLEMVASQDAALAAERNRVARLRKDLAARDELIRQLRALSVEPR